MSYALCISSRLWAMMGADPTILTQRSSHDRACNFQTATGMLVAFVTSYHGNGPFHLVVSPLLLAQIQQQTVLYWHGDTLDVGTRPIAVGNCARWDAALPTLQVDTDTIFPFLYEPYRQRGKSDLGRVVWEQGANRAPALVGSAMASETAGQIYQRAQQATTWLYSGLCEDNEALIEEGARLLAGLGPGLTPAGDDFLVGLLAAFYALGPFYGPPHWKAWQAYTHRIATTASDHTTRLSAAWLTHAGAGAFGEAWHHLIHAINGQQPHAISISADRILTTGATSGADAMGGFLWGLGVLKQVGK